MSALLPSNVPPTMSSREIALLVDKRHDNVKRTIETLIERGLVHPQSEDEPEKDAMGRARMTQVYRVGKRDSYVIVAQLSPEFTARLVDRWQELEAQVANPFLTMDRAGLLRFALENEEKVAALEAKATKLESKVDELAPQAEALKRIAASNETLTLTQAAKVLGIKRDELSGLLMTMGWIYRQNRSWVGYAQAIKAGWLVYKEAGYTDDTGMESVRPYCHLTQRGVTKIAERLASRPPRPRPPQDSSGPRPSAP